MKYLIEILKLSAAAVVTLLAIFIIFVILGVTLGVTV